VCRRRTGSVSYGRSSTMRLYALLVHHGRLHTREAVQPTNPQVCVGAAPTGYWLPVLRPCARLCPPEMPPARGPAAATSFEAGDLGHTLVSGSTSVLEDDDAQLTLSLAYELHSRGWADVDERWEWHPELVTVVALLEARMLADLRDRVTSRFGVVDSSPGRSPGCGRAAHRDRSWTEPVKPSRP
jgi:hypothetical protein